MASVGEILKNERLKKKITIDEVYLKTRITPKIITSIEEEKFDEFLNPTYVKYFLRTYAKFLGLNTEALIAKIEPNSAVKAAKSISEEAQRRNLKPLDFNREVFLKITAGVLIFAAITLTFIFLKNVVVKKTNTPDIKITAKKDIEKKT